MRRSGFTLLELLVVVIVVGVLASLGLASLVGFTDRSREAEATASLNALMAAQEAYRLRGGTFTTNRFDLDVEQADLQSWAAVQITAGTSGFTVGGISTAALTDGVSLNYRGSLHPNPDCPGGTHTNHQVRGIIVSNGARQIDVRGR